MKIINKIVIAHQILDSANMAHGTLNPRQCQNGTSLDEDKCCAINRLVTYYFYTLLFHSLFKVEFNIDHFVLREHRER